MNLDDTLTSFVPFQRMNDARAAILAADDVVPIDEHNAAVKKEIDWQYHWLKKFEAAEHENFGLRQAIDVTAVERFNAVLRLIRDDIDGGKDGKHDDTCHRRHAACLARRVHEALTGDGS